MSLASLLVDLAAGADSWKRACRVVAVANVTLSGEQTIDSVAVVEGERVLLTAQTLAATNGPWVVALGAWTRPADFDASSKVQFGTVWKVTSGTLYAGTTWILTSPVSGTPALGVTSLAIAADGTFSAALAAAYTYAPTLASVKAITGVFLRGVTTGGWLFTPGADGAVTTAAAVNADGTTAKPMALTATQAQVNAGTQVQAEQGGTTRVTDTVAAAYTRVYSAALTSLSDTIAQHGSAAGITRTWLGQRGFAGTIGGDCIVGAGDGGTPGTNAPGVYRVKTRTPVANVGGKVAFEHEDGTRWLEILQTVAAGVTIYGGPSAGPTHAVTIRAPYVVLETTSNYISLTSGTDVYVAHAAGRDLFHLDGSTVAITQRNVFNGVSYSNYAATVTSAELRHNTSPRVAFDSTSVTLSGDVVYRENAAGTEFSRTRESSATISSATTTYVESFDMSGFGNGAYDVEMVATLHNTTDGESACYRRFALFNRTGGTPSQVGATDTGGTTDKESAGQVGNDATIDRSGDVIRFGFVTDSANTHKVSVETTIRWRTT